MKAFDFGVRAYRMARFGARQLRAWHTLSDSIGTRPAFFAVIKQNLGLASFDDASLEARQKEVAAVAASVEAWGKAEAESLSAERSAREQAHQQLESRVSELQSALEHINEALRVTRDQHAAQAQRIEREQQRFAQLSSNQRATDLHASSKTTSRLARLENLTSLSGWVSAVAANELKVSVVLATYNRSDRLVRAVNSVLSQEHTNFELIIIDDGSTDRTPQLVAELCARDSRVKGLRLEHRGASAARNRGLAAATGRCIAYVDDDNLMWPGWLKTIAWGFEHHPDADVIYGARLVEKVSTEAPATPYLEFEPFDRALLESRNYIDLGVLSHRAGLPDARFDESLTACTDWDLVLRLTRSKAPLALPAIASAYSLSAPNRISDRRDPHVAVEHVRRRHSTRRLKVLAYNSLFPLLTETYIADELEALARQGAQLAFCREHRSVSPMRINHPLLDMSLEAAAEQFEPDLLFLHWAGHAHQQAERLEKLAVPFAVRVHSFDFDPDTINQVRAHPYCVGVWAYPHHAQQLPGVHALTPLFTAVDALPAPAANRDLVLSVSAGLPKKDWDLLVEAMAAVSGAERRIVVGITNEFELLPGQVAEKLARYRDPPLLQVNLEREAVFSLLSRTAVLVYTLAPQVPVFGMPMSVIEAMCAGAIVVTPDRAEARALCGPGFRGYRTAAELTEQIQSVLVGGPRIEAERASNRAYARGRFCDAGAQKRFFDEVHDALEAWRVHTARRCSADEVLTRVMVEASTGAAVPRLVTGP